MSQKNNKTLMDVVHPVAAGIDIASAKLDVTIIRHHGANTQPDVIYQAFSTKTKDLYRLRDFLIENGCFYVCMESTGIYWMSLYSVLEEAMEEIRVVNAKYVKAIRGKKDDQRDSEWICHQYRLGLTEGSYIPNKDIRDMRNLMRYRTKLVQTRTSMTNRQHKQLRMVNITLDTVLKDINSKTGYALIDLIISKALKKEELENHEILKRIDPRCRKERKEIIDACRGVELSESSLIIIGSLRQNISALNIQIDLIEKQMYRMIVELCPEVYSNLMSIPGVGKITALNLIAEVGFELSSFGDAAHLVSWAGLCPACNQSGGKPISTHISKGGRNLKPMLVEASRAAVKTSEYYKAKHASISSRQGDKRATIAIARKILVAVYHIIVKNEPWKPSDLEEAEKPLRKLKKKADDALKKAISDAHKLGKGKEELATDFVTYLNEVYPNIP